MKPRTLIFLLAFLVAMATNTAVFADSVIVTEVTTAKAMYLLDPYYWVYSDAVDFKFPWPARASFWQPGGHSQTVDFSVCLYDFDEPNGIKQLREDGGILLFDVLDGEEVVIADQPLEWDGNSFTYGGSFDITEDLVGGIYFKPGDAPMPKALTVQVKDSGEVLKDQTVFVNRWGCDRCHISAGLARQIYPWSAPLGGALGPHYWGNILGRNGGRPGFTYENLTNAKMTHTPTVGGFVWNVLDSQYYWITNPLNRAPYHMKTNVKQCGNIACTPCHQGEGTIRPAWVTGCPSAAAQQDLATQVKCAYCHGMDGGYIPADPYRPAWADYNMYSQQ